ncbi:hypothetical protein QAD02_015501 [Eretmocerus hayati]|uniref:Uncharacterized protein n=1 Tax=Eretmocerus hayati TaxID=131215 RepID=A0ACC2PAV7_9HYME|nr:hypothetical protein QAD02_015501 [Eretmocerus hayati]
MRLFKRRSLDQSPELVSATPISQDVQSTATATSTSNCTVMPPPASTRTPKAVQRQPRTPPSSNTLRRTVNSPNNKQQRETRPNSAPFTPTQLPKKLESQPKLKSTPLSFSAKSLSSLGKKVGEKWHQLKRADSSELLSSAKKVAKKNDDPSTTPTSSPDLSKTKRVGRIESLRNLFRSTSSSSLSGATSRSNSKNRPSAGDEQLERGDSDSGHQLEKSLSEGMLQPLTRPRAELERKRLELLRDIQEMERQNRLFEFILSDEKTIATNEGCNIARRVIQETDSTIMRRRQLRQTDAELMRHRQRTISDGSDLSGRRSNRTSASSNELRAPALIADPFDEEHGLESDLALDPRRESVRSCELKGLEDLMSALKLGGGDESGYDTESTRNGADSPDSGASVSIATAPTTNGSVALVDCEGIDLSIMPLDSPDKQQRQVPPRKKRLRSEGISEESELREHLISPSERHQDDTTLVAEDDNHNDTGRTETTILAVTQEVVPSPPVKKQQEPKSLRQKLSFRTQRKAPQQRTPEKKRPAPEVPPRSASRVQSEKNPLLRTCSKAGNRRLSNASVLNLLDNASSPCKDSPPQGKLPLSTKTPPRPRYYNPKRSHAELEADEAENSPMATSSPVESTPAKNKLRRPIFDRTSVTRCASSSRGSPLVRRELKTMKLRVERAGELGLSVHRCEAARPYYVVSAMDEQGEAAKSKQFRIGDEVVRVCGRRLRGMSLAEARQALRYCHGDVELQIAREPNFYFGKEPGDTWEIPKTDEIEQQKIMSSKSEAEVWGPMTLKPGSPVRFQFEEESMTTAVSTETTVVSPVEKTIQPEVDCVAEEMISASQSTVAEDEEKDTDMADDEAEECEGVGAVTKDGRTLSAVQMECFPSPAVISVDEPKPTSGMLKFQVRRRSNTVSSDQGGIRRRAASMSMDILTIELDKGVKQALGFTIVGGVDSPNGAMGIYVKSVLPGGQAAEQGSLRAKDEVLAVNGQSLEGLTHAEAVQLIKTSKKGKLVLHVARRDPSACGRQRLISSRSGL